MAFIFQTSLTRKFEFVDVQLVCHNYSLITFLTFLKPDFEFLWKEEILKQDKITEIWIEYCISYCGGM